MEASDNTAIVKKVNDYITLTDGKLPTDESNITSLQNDNITNKANILSLQTDNTLNKSNISTHTSDITSLKTSRTTDEATIL